MLKIIALEISHRIQAALSGHQELIDKVIKDEKICDTIEQWVALLIKSLQSGNRIWFCGNGGSAADAQHLAAELSGRFYLDRKALSAEALHVNSSFITAVGNDFGYRDTYSRALEAHAREGDALILLSTSGSSENIIEAAHKGHKMGVHTFCITGNTTTKLHTLCRRNLKIPSTDTPRIQEATMLIGHIICELIEAKMFGDDGE